MKSRFVGKKNSSENSENNNERKNPINSSSSLSATLQVQLNSKKIDYKIKFIKQAMKWLMACYHCKLKCNTLLRDPFSKGCNIFVCYSFAMYIKKLIIISALILFDRF